MPKRKAPPPPNRPPARLPRAISVPSEVNQLCLPAVAAVEGGACPASSKSPPPRKPPRTQSTFLSDICDLLASSFDGGGGRPDSKYYTLPPSSPPSDNDAALLPREPNDYEPLTHPVTVDSGGGQGSKSITMIPHKVVDVFDSTLGDVATCHMERLYRPHIPWEVEWAELTMCTDELGQQHLYYHNECCVAVEVSPVTATQYCDYNTQSL